MRNRLRSLSIILLGMLIVSAGSTKQVPIGVAFGPNIDLSVESNAASIVDAETTIAVNPTNSANMVEGNMGGGGWASRSRIRAMGEPPGLRAE